MLSRNSVLRSSRAARTNGGCLDVHLQETGDRLHQIPVDYATTSDHYKGIPGEYHCYVYTDTLTPADLVRERDRVEQSVRHELGIPYNAGAPAKLYEHSMGQSGALMPESILKQSTTAKDVRAA